MKKILLIMVCTGMTIGLLVTGAGNVGKHDIKKAAAMANQGTAMTCTISACSMDEFIAGRNISLSLSGVEGYKASSLQTELNDLKAELSELEAGTKEYNERIADIHHALGKISVLLGELNSTIDVQTETMQKMSDENTNTIPTDYEFTGILYIADTE